MTPKRRSVQEMEIEDLHRHVKALQDMKLLNKVMVEQVMETILMKRMI